MTGKTETTTPALSTPPPKREKPLSDSDLNLIRECAYRHASRFRFGNRAEDIYHDLVVEFIRTNYMERFDPSKNSRKGYVSGFVFHHLCKVFKVSKYSVAQAEPIEEAIAIPDKSYRLETIQNRLDIQSLSTALDRQFPYTSGIAYAGLVSPETPHRVVKASDTALPGETIVWRSLSTIFTLLFSGHSHEEIAAILKVSRGWASKQVLKIKSVPEVVEWYHTRTLRDPDSATGPED